MSLVKRGVSGEDLPFCKTIFQTAMIQVFQGKLLSQAFCQVALTGRISNRGNSQWDFFLLSVHACFWQDGKEKMGLILQPLLMGIGISKQTELPA